VPRIPFLLRRPVRLLSAPLPARLLDQEILMKKKLMLLALALAAVIAASRPTPAAAIGCKQICSGPDPSCCVYCCTNQPCALPICDF
jgi:hypothetical protein